MVQEAFDAGKIMAEASRSTPLFFILFPGYSPSKDIEAFAASQDRTVKNGKLTLISMGQVTASSLPASIAWHVPKNIHVRSHATRVNLHVQPCQPVNLPSFSGISDSA